MRSNKVSKAAALQGFEYKKSLCFRGNIHMCLDRVFCFSRIYGAFKKHSKFHKCAFLSSGFFEKIYRLLC